MYARNEDSTSIALHDLRALEAERRRIENERLEREREAERRAIAQAAAERRARDEEAARCRAEALVLAARDEQARLREQRIEAAETEARRRVEEEARLRRVQAELDVRVTAEHPSTRVWIAVTSALGSLLVAGSVAWVLAGTDAGHPEGTIAAPDHADRIAEQMEAVGRLERELDTLRDAYARRVAAAEDAAAATPPADVEPEPAPKTVKPATKPSRPPRGHRPPREPSGPASTSESTPVVVPRHDAIHFNGDKPLDEID